MGTDGVLVGQTCFSRLEYLGEDDRFGPFVIVSKENGEPSATGLTRCDAIDWMAHFVGWGRRDAAHQVDEAVQWYGEMAERNSGFAEFAAGFNGEPDVDGQ